MQVVHKKFTEINDDTFGTGVPNYTVATEVQVMFPKWVSKWN